MKNITKDNKGFTIIEVLIVLAIAGLILLVVFLAVPALQRNSRNTQRKSDISALAGAIQEYTANNGGAPLTKASVLSAVSNAKLGFYTASNVFSNDTGTPPSTVGAAGTAGSSSAVTTDSAIIWVGYDCSAGNAVPPVKASARSTAIEYAVEGGSGAIIQCTQS